MTRRSRRPRYHNQFPSWKWRRLDYAGTLRWRSVCSSILYLTSYLTSAYRNPGGIRYGSAEIYEVLDLHFSKASDLFVVADYLAVGQKLNQGADERVILFVKLPEGHQLTSEFESKMRAQIRASRSPRHVPARVCQTDRSTPAELTMFVFHAFQIDHPSHRYPLHPERKTSGSLSQEGENVALSRQRAVLKSESLKI